MLKPSMRKGKINHKFPKSGVSELMIFGKCEICIVFNSRDVYNIWCHTLWENIVTCNMCLHNFKSTDKYILHLSHIRNKAWWPRGRHHHGPPEWMGGTRPRLRSAAALAGWVSSRSSPCNVIMSLPKEVTAFVRLLCMAERERRSNGIHAVCFWVDKTCHHEHHTGLKLQEEQHRLFIQERQISSKAQSCFSCSAFILATADAIEIAGWMAALSGTALRTWCMWS